MEDAALDVMPEVVPPEDNLDTDGVGTDPAPQAEEQPPEKPLQSPEDNARFADMRRKQELETARQEMARVKSEQARLLEENKRLTSTLNTAGYQGGLADIADQIEATTRGITPEQVRYERLTQERQREEELQAFKQSDPDFVRTSEENLALRQALAERTFADDLAAIKAHNPKETAKSIHDFGPEFMLLMSTAANRGEKADPIRAYEMIRAGNSLKQPPKSMGDIGQQPETTQTNRFANMSDDDFEKEVRRAERGDLRKG